MKSFKPFIPGLIWGLFILLVDLIPASPIKNQEKTWLIGPDKIIHFIQHFVLSSLIFFGYLRYSTSQRIRIFWSIVIPLLFGVMIELIQEFFVPYRSFNLKDILANALGTLLFVLCIKIIIKIHLIIFKNTKL